MLSGQVIEIIERNAEELTRGAIKRLHSNTHTRSYHALSSDDLYRRLFDIYHDLGDWLLKNEEQTIRSRYYELGKHRFHENIPLAEVLWALVLTKEHLRETIGGYMSADSALELHRQGEIYRLIGWFFDRAMCYVAEAYESEASRRTGSLAGMAH